MSAVAQTRQSDEFSGDHHVYEPHKVGLPPLGPYFRALWARRQFLYRARPHEPARAALQHDARASSG